MGRPTTDDDGDDGRQEQRHDPVSRQRLTFSKWKLRYENDDAGFKRLKRHIFDFAMAPTRTGKGPKILEVARRIEDNLKEQEGQREHDIPFSTEDLVKFYDE